MEKLKIQLKSLFKKRTISFLLLFFIIVLGSLVIEIVGFNFKTLTLSENNKGIFSVTDYTFGDNKVRIKPQRYINDLIITTHTDKRVEYTVSYNVKQPNGTYKTKVMEGSIFPEIPEEFIHIGGDYTNIILKIDYSIVNIKSIEVYNILTFSFHRFIYFILFFSSLTILFLLRKLIYKRVEIGFLITAVFVGVAFSYLIPVNVGLIWDDETHFPRIYALFSVPVERNVSLATYEMYSFKWAIYEDNTYKHKFYNEEDEMKYYEVLNQNDKISTEYTLRGLTAKLKFTGYIAPALGISLGRLLNLSFTTQFIMGRISNLIIYLGVVFYAIKRSKRFKLSIAAMGLLPVSLFLASSYSYDSTTIGFLMLGTVLIMNDMNSQDQLIKKRDILIILFSFFIAVFHKMVYFPIFFLFYLIPRKKFESKKIYNLSILLNLSFIILIIAAFILPLVMFPTGVIGDVRGGNVNAIGQVKFIFENILTYTLILIQNIKNVLVNYVFVYPYANMAYLGLTDNVIQFALMVMVIIVIIFDNKHTMDEQPHEINFKKRIISLLILIATIALVWTSMYLVFNPVGNTFIAGVQGRYFFPLFTLTLFILKPIKFYKVDISLPNLSHVFFLLYTLLVFISMYPVIIERFWK